MRAAALAGAAALIASAVAAPAPQDISVVNNAKVTNTLTTTYTKTKTVKETAVSITTTTKTITATDKTVQTITTTIGSGYTGVLPTVTVTGSCPAPATVTVTRTSGSSTSVATSLTTTLLAQQVSPTGHANPGLADLAAKVRDGIYFGTAVDYPGTNAGNDPIYLDVAQDNHEFNQWTPANTMKYFATEPQNGVFNFTGGDAFMALASQNGTRRVRCHNLIWHSQIPDWVANGNWTADTLTAVMERHIETLMLHWGDQCLHWDVVNEALADGATAGGNPWRTGSVWQRVIGPTFVEKAFRKAAQVKRDNNLTVGLYYNDYSIEWPGTKTTNAAILAYNLTQAGIAIDGIGAQSHFTIGGSPPVRTFMDTLANYTNKVNTVTGKNLEVAITELDIRGTLPISREQQIQQFYDYGNATQACALTQGCVGITLWDFDDTYSWIPYTFPGQGWAHPWFLPANGTELVKKLAYDGIRNGLTNGTAL